MRLRKHISEEAKVKMVASSMGKVRVIEGWKKHKRLYVHRVKSQKAYMVTLDRRINLDDMVMIDGRYWWGTLKELKQALENDK